MQNEETRHLNKYLCFNTGGLWSYRLPWSIAYAWIIRERLRRRPAPSGMQRNMITTVTCDVRGGSAEKHCSLRVEPELAVSILHFCLIRQARDQKRIRNFLVRRSDTKSRCALGITLQDNRIYHECTGGKMLCISAILLSERTISWRTLHSMLTIVL
jgi:hypothetical protein